MIITFKKDTFLKQLFPEIDIRDDKKLVEAIKIAYLPEEVEVILEGETVRIELEKEPSINNPNYFFRATELCRVEKYLEAIPIFEQIRQTNPADSEFYRNYAQAYEEVGEFEKAIDILIDALRLDPKNKWALILMGNIYVRHHKDFETAMTYFNQVMETDPKNHILLSNIGGVFIGAGRMNLAERFMKKALESNPDFPNTLHGLGIINHSKGNLIDAFDLGVKALKNAVNKEQKKTFENFILKVSSEYTTGNQAKASIDTYIDKLKSYTGKDIKVELDPSIPSEAKLEVAENYKRDYHKVVYKDNYPAINHLIAHELTHLKFLEDARRDGTNQLFTSGSLEKRRFKDTMAQSFKKLAEQGVPEDKINTYIDMVFHGTNSRIFNAPIDLFIEDYLYNQLPELRPIQFFSLLQLGNQSLQAVTDKSILDLNPYSIVGKIKIYNTISARQFDELFGMETEKDYPLSIAEKNHVDSLWEEYNEYRRDKEPGEEYEIIQNWGEDLGLSGFFKLVEENNKSNDIDDLLSKAISEDKSTEGLNMEVVSHMVQAISYFKDKGKEVIEDCALETAMLAKGGISPTQTGIKLKTIPDKTFTGFEIISYYYVSWALFKPEFTHELGLPYENEYEVAKNLFMKGPNLG